MSFKVRVLRSLSRGHFLTTWYIIKKFDGWDGRPRLCNTDGWHTTAEGGDYIGVDSARRPVAMARQSLEWRTPCVPVDQSSFVSFLPSLICAFCLWRMETALTFLFLTPLRAEKCVLGLVCKFYHFTQLSHIILNLWF